MALYFDKQGYPVSKDDAYDSAVRAGILSMTGSYSPLLEKYIDAGGRMRRHPTATGASNYKNCTRDQMLPLIAAYYAQCSDGQKYRPEYLQDLRKFFWARFRDFFFMQNTERDREGSRKYLYPHTFYKDSNPTTETKTSFNSIVLDPEKNTIESRVFDGADPLLPNHIWFLIRAARLYWLYPFALIGIPFFLLTLILHSVGKHNEENQMIGECFVNGKWALKLYKLVNRRWEARSKKYWEERNEIEYHDMLVKMMGEI